MKKKLKDATATQIADYGAAVLNLPNMVPTRGKEVLLSEIGRTGVTPETEVELGGVPEEVSPGATSAPPAKPKPDDLVTIVIPQQDDDTGSGPVWVAVNDKGQWLPRDQEITVKHKYVEALEHAVKTVPVTDPATKRRIGTREVPRFPYRRVA